MGREFAVTSLQAAVAEFGLGVLGGYPISD